MSAVALGAIPSAGLAEPIKLVCEWQLSSPKYAVEFAVDLSKAEAIRSDTGAKYQVLKANADAFWLMSKNANYLNTIIEVIARSQVGGNWTETWLWADGTTSPVAGGYCVEGKR